MIKKSVLSKRVLSVVVIVMLIVGMECITPATITYAAVPSSIGLFHDQADIYISNIEPIGTESVTLKLRCLVNDLTSAIIKYYDFGDSAYHTVSMTKLSGTDNTGNFEFWQGVIPASESKKRYRFQATNPSGSVWVNSQGISSAEPSGYTWDWWIVPNLHTPAWAKNAIYYSIMPDSFYNADLQNDMHYGYDMLGVPQGWGTRHFAGNDWYGGDLNGINAKLSYIKDTLGATAIYINPVWTALHNAGYGQFNYDTVNPVLGTNNELQTLISSIHSSGMKFIMDGVYLYSLRDSKWFDKLSRYPTIGAYESQSSSYYNRYYWSSWPNSTSGDVFLQPKLNYSSSALKDDIYRSDTSAMQRFLRAPYNIDGWRLDVPAYNSTTTDGYDVEKEMRTYVKGVNNEALLMGELSYTNADIQGDALDSVWNYARFHDPVRGYLGGKDATGNPVSYSETDMQSYFQNAIGDIPRSIAQCMYNMIDTHDVKRILRFVNEDESMMKLAMVYQTTFVGCPVVYYGDEIGASSDGPYDSMTSMDWDKKNWNNDIFNTYRSLIELRKNYSSLSDGLFKVLLADNANKTFSYGRWNSSNQVIVITNKDSLAKNITVSAMQLGITNGSAMTDWMSGSQYTVGNGNITAYVPAKSSAILVAGSNSEGVYRGKWQTEDIGSAVGGYVKIDSVNYNIGGNGTIGGTSDSMRYMYMPAFGDFTATVKVVSQGNTNSSAKAGIMIRQSANANSAYYMVAQTPGSGVSYSYRRTAGGTAVTASSGTTTYPVWLKIERTNNTFKAYSAVDSGGSPGTWTLISGSTQTFRMDNEAICGLAASSNTTTVSNVAFQQFAIQNGANSMYDTFSSTVAGSMWTVNNPDSTNFGIDSGTLNITTQDGNKNIITAKPPKGDWSAKIKLHFAPGLDGQEAGLVAYGDENNMLRISRIRQGGTVKLALISRINGYEETQSIINDPDTNSDIYMQLNKVGAFISGCYSFDDNQWTNLGVPYQANISDVQVGMTAIKGGATGTASASFDFFTFGDFNTNSTSNIYDSNSGTADTVFTPSGHIKWVPVLGTWTDCEGGYEQTDIVENRSMNIDNKTYDNMQIDVTIKIKSLSTAGWAGISLRRSSISHNFWDSGYLIYLTNDGNLSVYKNGSDISGASSVATGANMNNDVRLRALINGSNIKVFVNGAASPLININDSSYNSGYLSFYTTNSNAQFKNIQINPLFKPLQVIAGDNIDACGNGFKTSMSNDGGSYIKGNVAVSGRAYRDVDISSQFKLNYGKDMNSWAGYFIHAAQGSQFDDDGYYVYFKRNGYVGVKSKGTIISEVNSGVNMDNSFFTAKVEVRGDNIKVCLNNYCVPVIDCNVTGEPCGSISFISNECEAEFTNISTVGKMNLARNCTSSASSSIENYGFYLSYINDGVMTSGWSSNGYSDASHTEWVKMDLGSNKTISTVELVPRYNPAGGDFPVDFTIAVSTDNINWNTVVTQTNYSNPGATKAKFNFTAQTARYVRVMATNLGYISGDGYRMQLYEVEVYNVN